MCWSVLVALGECLGHHHPFWKELALEYPMAWSTEFAGLDLCTAIRRYTFAFRLPGESAPIERVLDGFAKGYFAAQQGESSRTTAAEPTGSDRPSTTSIVDLSLSGWYVRQPMSNGKPCCASCGKTNPTELATCWGCKQIHFCTSCRRHAGKMGHAIRGKLGYGRACVAACAAAGTLAHTGDGSRSITFFDVSSGGERSERVCPEGRDWQRRSPFKSSDSVFVLSYAIIMLTTNLHNPSVPIKEKMTKAQFISQNREVNEGDNFPGDFLSIIYDDIQAQELQVMGGP